MDSTLATTDAQTAAWLTGAHRHRLARIAWQMGAIGTAIATVLTALFGAGLSALFDFGALGNSTLLGLTTLPLLLSVVFVLAGRRAAQHSKEQLERAWQYAVGRLLAAAGGQLSPEQLARTLGITTDEATERLAEAEVNQLLEADPDAPLRVRVADQDAERLERVARQELEQALGDADTEYFPVSRNETKR